jgi:hypothetical protein
MTVDLRVAYDFDLGPFAATVLADVYNFFGSGTEMLEDMRTGPDYRTSIEMVPGRGLHIQLSLH